MRTVTSSQGHTITIGENASENQGICKRARQNDLWFHLEGQSSPHAILSVAGGKAVTDNAVRDSIHEASQLVKHYSSAREVRSVGVIFIEAKFVSKNGVEDKIGAVTLKRAPRKRMTTTDEPALIDLLARVERQK